MGAVLDPFYWLIARIIVIWHDVTGAVFGHDSGLAWALAIIMLTVTLRLLLFPVFVKQIKTQRVMTELQPKIKALQAKHKGDRQTMNTELMKLYKEHNANPMAGCLPLIIQMPVFIALFQVLNQLRPKVVGGGDLLFPEKFGITQGTAESLGRAKIFGAPIAAAFNSPRDLLDALNSSPGVVKAVAVALIILMTGATFITTKQMMAKNVAQDSAQATQQKVLLYLMPAMLALFGFQFPIGVLLYWTTTNVWSFGQQHFILKRIPHPKKGDSGNAARSSISPTPAPATPGVSLTEGRRPAADRRPAANRSKKRGKGQRRGGRR